MSAGLALPSRPRAVRVIGVPARSPSSDTAALTKDLRRFIHQQPAQALQVLEDWLESCAAAKTARPAEELSISPQPGCQDGRTHDGNDHDACN